MVQKEKRKNREKEGMTTQQERIRKAWELEVICFALKGWDHNIQSQG